MAAAAGAPMEGVHAFGGGCQAAWSSGLARTAMEAQLVACIQESLSQCLYDNARWLAERLVAAAPSEANVHLLAVCYFHSNQAYRAFHLLRSTGASSPHSRYLLAQCCVQLGKWQEARDALLKHGQQQVPQGAAGLYLLARVLRALSLAKEAKELLVEALQANPLLWCAYEDLCAMGADEEAREVCTTAGKCEAQLSWLVAQAQAAAAAASHPHPGETSPAAAAAGEVQQQQQQEGAGDEGLENAAWHPDARAAAGEAHGGGARGAGARRRVNAGGAGRAGGGAAAGQQQQQQQRRTQQYNASRSPSPSRRAAGELDGGGTPPSARDMLPGAGEDGAWLPEGRGEEEEEDKYDEDDLMAPVPWLDQEQAHEEEQAAAGASSPPRARRPDAQRAPRSGRAGATGASGAQGHSRPHGSTSLQHGDGGGGAEGPALFATPSLHPTAPRQQRAAAGGFTQRLQGSSVGGGGGGGGSFLWDFSGGSAHSARTAGAAAPAPGRHAPQRPWDGASHPHSGPGRRAQAPHGGGAPGTAGRSNPFSTLFASTSSSGDVTPATGHAFLHLPAATGGTFNAGGRGLGMSFAAQLMQLGSAAPGGGSPGDGDAFGAEGGLGVPPLRLLGLLGGGDAAAGAGEREGPGSLHGEGGGRAGRGGGAAASMQTPPTEAGGAAPPPPPPRKQHAHSHQAQPALPTHASSSSAAYAFPGFAHPPSMANGHGSAAAADVCMMGHAPSAATPAFQPQGASPPPAPPRRAPAHGHHGAAAVVRVAMDDGKVRKVSGRALFSAGAVAPQGGTDDATPHGDLASPPGGRAAQHLGASLQQQPAQQQGSPSRRSSRLAALARGVASTPASPVGGSLGGAAAAAAAAQHGTASAGRVGGALGAQHGQRGAGHRVVAAQRRLLDPALEAAAGGGWGAAQAPAAGGGERALLACVAANSQDLQLKQEMRVWGAGKRAGDAAGKAAAGALLQPVLAAGTAGAHGGGAAAPELGGTWLGTLGTAAALCMLHHAYEGYRHMAMYRGSDALEEFQLLPACQRRTAWVQLQVGRVLLDRMEYLKAAEVFEHAHQLDRYRVEGLELYSTVLWHLRRDADLSFLAQHALATDRLAPNSWCVVGNLMSLHKEHEAALRLFERALQIDPSFTYAYTLSGHEYAASEEPDQALACYRNALRTNPRHYNALYGMGCVYFRQEKYDVALCHFRSAASIAPGSSVLHCYLGMTLQRQGCHEQALAKLQAAIELDPRNPLARYEKAAALAAHGDDEAALREYCVLLNLAPGEPSVFLQMGKLFKRMGQLPQAQRHMEMALSFSASSADAASIKAAIDKLALSDEQEEEELL